MPAKSIYWRQDGAGHYTPATFTIEYNKHPNLDVAAKVMGFDKTRLSVIASRLRSRGHRTKFFGPNGRGGMNAH